MQISLKPPVKTRKENLWALDTVSGCLVCWACSLLFLGGDCALASQFSPEAPMTGWCYLLSFSLLILGGVLLLCGFYLWTEIPWGKIWEAKDTLPPKRVMLVLLSLVWIPVTLWSVAFFIGVVYTFWPLAVPVVGCLLLRAVFD